MSVDPPGPGVRRRREAEEAWRAVGRPSDRDVWLGHDDGNVAAVGHAQLVETLSYNSLGPCLGIAVRPAVCEQLLRAGGYPAAWAGAAALGALATAVASLLPRQVVLDRRREDGSGLRAPLVAGRLPVPGVAFVCGLVGAAVFLAFVAIYARELGQGGAGGVLATYGAVVVASRLGLARVADRWSAELVAAGSLLLAATGLAVTAWAPSGGWLYPGAVLLGLGSRSLRRRPTGWSSTGSRHREAVRPQPPSRSWSTSGSEQGRCCWGAWPAPSGPVARSRPRPSSPRWVRARCSSLSLGQGGRGRRERRGWAAGNLP